MRLEPGQQLGDYTIVRRLGQGGMGTVYQARAATGQPVVLKVPFEQLLEEPGTQARYERELEIARTLDHPNIQRLLATGKTNGDTLPYTVLEWVDGGLLRDHLYEGRPLRADEAVRITTQICDALEYCHQRGIIHRDLKPDNALLTRDGQVKLMDFGAALLEGGRKITTASLSPALGTPDYMSPEQVQGQRGDARSDVYSLGVMTYEMLAGEPPYRGDNALAVMAQHVQSRPPPLRSKNNQVSIALAAVVAKALRRDPDARYQTVAAFRDDLLHLDQVDPAALAAECPENQAARAAGNRRPRALIIAGALAAAAFLLLAGMLLSRTM